MKFLIGEEKNTHYIRITLITTRSNEVLKYLQEHPELGDPNHM